MNTTDRKKPFNTIITHRSVHLDEIVSIILLQAYGESVFPGISKAAVRYVTDEPKGSDASFDADGIVPVGVGRGRFDDKNADGSRKRDTCAAKLVAMHLGVSEEPAWKRILAEVLLCDSKKGTSQTQLAGIVKAVNRSFGGDQQAVITFVRTALLPIVEQERYPFAPGAREKSALDYLRRAVAHRKLDDARVLTRLEKLFTDSARNGSSVTEMDYAVRAMQRQNVPDKDIAEWFEFGVTRLYQDQVAFQSAVDDIRVDQKTRRGTCSYEIPVVSGHHDEVRQVRTIIIRSDTPSAHSAAFSLGYELCVCRRSTGHVQLFVREHNGPGRLTLRRAVSMLRWLELPKSAKKTPLSELECPGEHPLVPHWHYFAQAQQVFNGTATHTAVSPTQMSLSAIEDVLQNAFHGGAYMAWQRQRGIPQPQSQTSGQNGTGSTRRRGPNVSRTDTTTPSGSLQMVRATRVATFGEVREDLEPLFAAQV